MGDKTGISWTDYTFNPWIGCSKVSAGCENCYAWLLSEQKKLGPKYMGAPSLWGKGSPRYVTSDSNWRKPLRWNRKAEKDGVRRRVFCASMCDILEDHPVADATRPRLWELIRQTPWLDWQILTKRPERIAACLPPDWGTGYLNVWLGTSVEDQQRADQRIPLLLSVSAVVHFLSVEPLLEPVNIEKYLGPDRVNWIIVGGESGPNFRPMDHAWARSIRDQAKRAGVAFFFKQSAGRLPGRGTAIEEVGGQLTVAHEFPTPQRVVE